MAKCGRGWFILLIGILGVIVMQVAAQSANRPLPASAPPLPQHKSLGDVRLTLDVDQQTMGIADRLRLTLSVDALSDTIVTFPQVTAKLGPFTVLRQNASAPVTTAPHMQQWTREYVLEADHAGALTIPSLTVSFQPPETSQDVAPQQLSTDALVITVTSVLPDDADITAPKDIAPPVALTRRGVPAWIWITAAGLVGLGLPGSLWWWYRCRGPHAAPLPPPQPAHVLALEALRRLQRDDLIALQRIEEYYVRLSDILRRYIEWRFGLRAPEQTTEEFLVVVLDTGGLIATHSELLSAFLRHCDLVKFARHQPTADDMQQALQSARAFIEQTADDQVMVAVWSSEVNVL